MPACGHVGIYIDNYLPVGSSCTVCCDSPVLPLDSETEERERRREEKAHFSFLPTVTWYLLGILCHGHYGHYNLLHSFCLVRGAMHASLSLQKTRKSKYQYLSLSRLLVHAVKSHILSLSDLIVILTTPLLPDIV